MNRRWMFAALALLLAGVVAFFLRPRDSISLALYQRIRLGMSFDEVKKLIGEPGVYIDEQTFAEGVLSRAGGMNTLRGPSAEGDASEGDFREFTGKRTKSWYGRAGGISIALDDNGLVVCKWFTRFAQRSFLDRVFGGPSAWFSS